MAFHLRRRALGARRPRGAAGSGAIVAVNTVAVLFGLAACSATEPAPTGIQSPTASASADPSTEWGAYSGKDDACSAVAGDVLTLALVPKNLALADPGGGVDDIDETIREAARSAPPAISPNYLQLSAIVGAYGRELVEWSDATAAASATPTASPAPSPSRSALPTQTGSAADRPERPTFVDTGYSTQLDRIKTWLSDTCG